MRNLTQEEKEKVQHMLNTPGFKIMEGLVKDFEYEVLRLFRKEIMGKGTITKEAQEDFIQKHNYLKGIEDFIQIIKGKSTGIGKRKED